MHAFVVREGKSPDPNAGKGVFSKKWTTYKTQRLNKFMKRKYKKTANLITGVTEQSLENQVFLTDYLHTFVLTTLPNSRRKPKLV